LQAEFGSGRMQVVRVPVIDMHTHFFPPGLDDFARITGDPRWPRLVEVPDPLDAQPAAEIRCGDKLFRKVDRRCFDLQTRLEDMDSSGVHVQVLSPVPITLATWADPQTSSVFLRAQNEAIARSIATCSSPERFRWMGGVTLQSSAEAIEDLAHGLDLGMVAIEIGTEAAGRELDDRSFDPFWQEVERAGVPVFVHPTASDRAIRRSGQPYEFALGMLTDTATAASALVFGGVLERFPGLRVGLAHGCGTFPWTFPRLIRGSTLATGEPSLVASNRLTAVVARLWADTLVFDPAHLPLLIERFGADHLMLGSDTPFYPAEWGPPVDMLAAAVERGLCSDDQRCAMLGANALRFLGGSLPTVLDA
jgi:aminocarboxymuconate-semialdehyde decarboxylase